MVGNSEGEEEKKGVIEIAGAIEAMGRQEGCPRLDVLLPSLLL